MKRTLLISAILALSLQVSAQDKANAKGAAPEYAVEVVIEKKIIHVHNLGLPETTTIGEVLDIMPEILSRPGEFLLTNYVIKIEDVSVDDASDAVLRQLRIADVEKIEVQESPIDTYNHNGEGGSINIYLSDHDNGLSGNVALDGSYQPDVIGGIHLRYKNDKGWRMHGIVKSEYYDPSDMCIEGGRRYERFTSGQSNKYSETVNERFFGQMARLYARHTTEHSSLDLAIGENNSYTKTVTGGQSTTKTSLYTFLGHAKYVYTFNTGSKLTAKGDYKYSPTNNWKNTIPTVLDETTERNTLSSQVEYLQPLVKTGNSALNLKVGAESNYSWTYLPNDSREEGFHVMPFIKFDGSANNWKYQLEAEFQNYSYSLSDKAGKDISKLDIKKHNDITGMFGVSYQMTPTQMLKFVAFRKIQRQNQYSLNPMKINEARLNYITDYVSDVDAWVLDLGAGYIYANDIVKSLDSGSGTSVLLFGNKNNIFHFDVMGLYQRGIFSLALTGNVYTCRMNYEKWETNKYTYYNISVLPSLNLNNGMHVALQYVHNSPVSQLLTRNGACNYMRMTLGKDFGAWNVHLFGQLNINKYKESNYEYEGMNCVCEEYKSYVISSLRNSIGVGLRYNF